MKNYLDGGEAILAAFRKLKIDYIMSSPGSEWSPVWEALARQYLSPISRACLYFGELCQALIFSRLSHC